MSWAAKSTDKIAPDLFLFVFNVALPCTKVSFDDVHAEKEWIVSLSIAVAPQYPTLDVSYCITLQMY